MIRKLPGVGDTIRFKFRNGEAWVEKEGTIYEVTRLESGQLATYHVQSGTKRHTIFIRDLIRDNDEERKASSIY